jgi:hypothetical protein
VQFQAGKKHGDVRRAGWIYKETERVGARAKQVGLLSRAQGGQLQGAGPRSAAESGIHPFFVVQCDWIGSETAARYLAILMRDLNPGRPVTWGRTPSIKGMSTTTLFIRRIAIPR